MYIDTNLTKTNYIEILIIIFTIFLILIIISILGIDLNPDKTPPKLIQEVTVESFINSNRINALNNNNNSNPQEQLDLLKEVKDMNLLPIDSFCASHLGKSGDLDIACSNLTKDTCLDTSCCVYTSSNTCVAGSKGGPTFTKHQQGLDHYYYKNKQFAKNK
jgi:hypothetical protein